MRILQRPSPSQSKRGASVNLVVIHGDAGRTTEGTLRWLEDPANRVSYHYLVDRSGVIYAIVPEGRKAWHAGESEWPDATVGDSVNPCSIGVAFANDGTGDEPYKRPQTEAGAELVAAILHRYGLPIWRFVGHADVSPGRKLDPWDHFDWRQFFGLVGVYATGRAP